jgi:Flp pilus assembly protein TadG
VLEFHFLGLLLLIPLVYVLITVLNVQKASYGVTQAAREAGRVFAATGSETAARKAADIALGDQGLSIDSAVVQLSCAVAPCYRPGNEITVDVRATVPLPMVPDALAGTVHTEIPVAARYAGVVDSYRPLP